jgi:2,4-diketo-3-deoxy-L-fuconate hydrolase
MKLCRYNNGLMGMIDGTTVYDITAVVDGITANQIESEFADPLVAAIPALLGMTLAELTTGVPAFLNDVALLSPVRRPSKILAAPDNYKAHLEEMQKNKVAGGRQPSTLLKDGLFLKATSSIAGPSQGIDVRFLDRRTDHEVELVAVMGVDGAVAGYAIGLDITLRGTEERSIRKSIDGYSVVGPWIVTADECDPDNVDLVLAVNGSIRQQTNTSDMLSNVALLAAYALDFYTLYPGDLIFTGTPSGVGPIVPGDTIEASGSGIGSMTVAVRAYAP